MRSQSCGNVPVDVRSVTGAREAGHLGAASSATRFRSEASKRMVSRIHRSTPRALRGAYLTLALLTVLTGVLPSCADAFCCPIAGEPTVQTQMPCCSQPSLAPRDALRSLPATSAGSIPSPQVWAPAAVVESSGAPGFAPPPRVQATLTTASVAPSEPRPPIFLLNAQFLI